MGPVSPHWFTAVMVVLKVVFTSMLLGVSLKVITVLVQSPQTSVKFISPDVQFTLMS